MTALVILRTVFLVVVMLGFVVNLIEWREAQAITDRLRRARKNGLKHQAAANLRSSAMRRLLASIALTVLLGVLLNAPPITRATVSTDASETARREQIARAATARVCFIAIAILITESGFAARRGRRRTVDLIDAEIAKEDEAAK